MLYSGIGTINLTGGTLNVLSGSGAGLYTAGGIIDVFGTGFTYAPFGGAARPITSGPLTGTGGTISGTLLNGQTLSTTYRIASGTIYVNVGAPPAPEPSQPAALGLGVLCVGALALRVRKKTSA